MAAFDIRTRFHNDNPATAPLLDVAGQYVELQPHDGGRYYLGLCPVHEDSRPSFSVQPGEGIWKCFTCNKGGGVVEFIQFVEGCSRLQAMDILRQNGWLDDSAAATVQRVLFSRRHGDLAIPVSRARKSWQEVLQQLEGEAWYTTQGRPVQRVV